MKFESKRGPKKKNTCFVSWKAFYYYYYYFITPFPLLQR